MYIVRKFLVLLTFLSFVTLMLLLPACGLGQILVEPTLTPTLTNTHTPTPTSTHTPTPTNTHTPTPTNTHTPTITNTPTPLGGGSGALIVVQSYETYKPSGQASYWVIEKLIVKRIDLKVPSTEFLIFESDLETKLRSFSSKTFSEFFFNFSPTGTDILISACSSGYICDKYLAPLDLHTFVPVPQYGWRWSPDGTKLVSVVGDWTEYKIYLMNKDGSGVKRLAQMKSSNRPRFWWSSDSKEGYWQQNNELRVINIDGTENQIINMDKIDPLALQCIGFSPNGEKVAFLNQTNLLNALDLLSGEMYKYKIYIANADFTDPIFVSEFSTQSAGCYSLRWSPDQSNLLFQFNNVCTKGSCTLTETDYVFRVSTGEMVDMLKIAGFSEKARFCGWTPDNSPVYISYADIWSENSRSYIIIGDKTNSSILYKVDELATNRFLNYILADFECPFWLPTK